MKQLEFDWDRRKALANVRKHGVGFREAASIFYDESALEFDDPEHSTEEARFLMLGMSSQARVLIVAHCIRGAGTVIRIISARKATTTEASTYWEQHL